MIDRQTIDKIMDATNIVDVVGDFVTLRKAGVNYKGLCPFHDDKTPSFMVSPSNRGSALVGEEIQYRDSGERTH